eukprot:11170633-Lingulodinium_polyedra.AAC.1
MPAAGAGALSGARSATAGARARSPLAWGRSARPRAAGRAQGAADAASSATGPSGLGRVAAGCLAAP